MKYIIIGYKNPNLKILKADINIYCQKEVPGFYENGEPTSFNIYWFTDKEEDLKYAVVFDSREECDKYIQNKHLENCISYGGEEEELWK